MLVCFGVTKNQNSGDFMLVLEKMDHDLRTFIRRNKSTLRWHTVYNFFWIILSHLFVLHDFDIAHKDLHSGNILLRWDNNWWLGDFGLCGPANKPTTSVYGNLPYMAPEVIRGKVYTTAADIYSIGMLMYEVSTGQPPFYGRVQNIHLAFDICSGIRPTIPGDIPESYKEMMNKCWDVEIANRPTTVTLRDYFCTQYQNSMGDSDSLVYADKDVEQDVNSDNHSKSCLHTYQNLPEPRNATKGKSSQTLHHVSFKVRI